MRRVLPVLALVASYALFPAPLRAEEDALRVPTRLLTHAEHMSEAGGRPGDLLAGWAESGVVPLTRRPPPGLGAVPRTPSLFYGTFVAAGRTFVTVLGRSDGATAALGVDLDGDGNVRGSHEVVEAEGRRSTVGGGERLTWRMPAQNSGPWTLDLTFRQAAATYDAVVLGASPAPLVLSSAPPAGVRPVPAGIEVRYGTVTTAGGDVPVAFVRGMEERLTVLVDVNGDGTLAGPQEMLAAPVAGREDGATFWETAALDVRGTSLAFAYRELPPAAEVRWKVAARGARKGRVTVGGQPYELHCLDADYDGSYTSGGDWWWFGPAVWLERFTQLLPVSMLPVTEPFRHGGVAWQLITMDDEGNVVVMLDRSAPSPAAYLHKRTDHVNRTKWFPLFERGGEFEERWGIDTARPRAPAPPEWLHDVGLDEALRRARAEKKPVLVDFEADWCTNCKRWDYHVYADAEVAGLLSRFVLLKINVDFNFASDITRLGGRNPPYLVFLDETGAPLISFPEVNRKLEPTGREVSGLMYFQRPTDFVQTLRAAYRAWIGTRGR